MNWPKMIANMMVAAFCGFLAYRLFHRWESALLAYLLYTPISATAKK